MIQGIDHLVILVDDLETGIANYRELGFTVTPGGKHPRGTHNALLTFEDGAYLELIAFWEPDYTEHRWHRHQSTGGGLIDHALGTDSLQEQIADANLRGIPYRGPVDGARTRPDGVELVWKIGHAQIEDHGLPFLIEDVTHRELRVPAGDAAKHANGVTGIDRLIVAVRDLDDTAGKYAALVGSEPGAGGEPTALDQETKAVTLKAGRHTIELHQPVGEGPVSEQLARRGDGPYAAIFVGAEAREFDPAQAGNARLRMVAR